ncbi:DNA recombination protein RmuC [Lutibaculum baratangense]|uniref:DNA recombination protein RmuC homolog n=1 Tax=Lutibaculum baratangense AMV1 TaxID=631454 RepID=V4RP06_9HYPH|nr:DNA recombination protein RmuC [Lutibaculum baratangense]ESR26989.1 DNA recombination protein RmuC [Lutibaculum baratangense AMV1]
MDDTLFTIGGHGVTWAQALGGAVALFVLLVILLRRRGAREAARHDEEIAHRLSEMARAQAEMTGRMQSMAEVFANRHSDLARALTERLDGFGHRLNQSMTSQARATHDSLTRLNERLAVIDTAQKNITELSRDVVGLQEILANKQTRGAFGQGRMEAIVADGLPQGGYDFQATLSNGRRPDCVVRLPNAPCLVIDAKFPLEAFTAYRDAGGPEARKAAAQRLRADVLKHVGDIAERYFIPGETQDTAIMFVPSESVYADLHEHFEDVVQRANRQRIIVVGPSLLMLSIGLVQAILRDHRMREQAHVIHKEVTLLAEDVGRLGDRVGKLKSHHDQAGRDIDQILTSVDKIQKRGAKIEELDFAAEDDQSRAQPRLMAGA